MKLTGILLLALLMLSPAKFFAADQQPFYIQQLDNRNGLSNSAINALFSDSDNLLWIATWDGLNLYDGSVFHVFNYGKDNSTSGIGNNVVQQITQDKNGFIWISTIEGLSRYDKKKGIFSNYFYTHSQRTGISEREYELMNDTAKNIYCLSRQHGLLYYNTAKDSFVSCKLPIQNSKIAKTAFDASNRLWILRQDGLLEVYAQNGDQYNLIRQFGTANAFFVVNNKVFYTTATKELFVADAALKVNLITQVPNAIKAITLYKDNFLFAWATHGFGVYDQNFRAASFLQNETQSLQNIKITSWGAGPEQILWCGTDGNGIIKISPQKKYFGSVSSNGSSQPFNKSVRAFCENGSSLWVGTKGSGIISIPRFNPFELSQNITTEKPFAGELENGNVFALYKGTDNLIYIGTDAKGICVYDPSDKRLVKWDEVAGSDALPVFASVYSIVQDDDNSVWLGTSGYGLIHLQLQKQNNRLTIKLFEQYTFDGTDKGPANDIIYAVEHGSDNKLWVGCRYGGLNLFDKKTKTFRIFKAFTYEGSLSHNDVLALYRDQHNRLWIGTSYGLNWINEANTNVAQPVFTKITSADGLPNNTVHAITEDNSQHIWVTTNKGLVKINPQTLAISQFQQKDGLQSNEFCDGAVLKNAAGILFFGGIYGFNYFRPDSIQQNNSFPNLLITGLQPGSKETDESGLHVLKPDQPSTLQYTLSRRENFFELELKAISFTNAEKCEYAYFLEGYDKKWRYSGGDGKITYSNIPPGSYSFKVKWSNGDGAWTNETVLFPLTIQQYFWLTWPAFLLYALLVSSGAVIFGLYKRSQFKMKMQLKMEHTLRTKEEEIHNEKLSFFTNIAHELQTPLTLIVGASEQNLQQKDEPYFKSLLHQQASRLTYLVQQLLEFRKAEAGFLKNQFVYLDISSFTKNIASLFIPMAKQKSMRYHITVDENINGWADKDKLEKMLFNLLSNAFKHSPREEEVSVDVQQNAGTNYLEITVMNTGCHIPDDQLDKIFHRFFASANSTQEKFSSGIGLAFTHQLAGLLNGSVSVSSNENSVKFFLSLPLPAEVDEASIQTEQPSGIAPSYLLQSIVSPADSINHQSAIKNNKMAKLDSLENDSKQSILIVDDEAPIRSLIKEVLGDQYIIYEAENGAEALEFIRQTQPDCIISDVMMPDMNGLELCEKVKEAIATCHIPFILLSARGAMEQKTEGYEAGADAYIAKPFHTEHLLVRVRKLLEYKQRMHRLFKKDNLFSEIETEEIADEDKAFLKTLVKFIEENIDDEKLGAEELEKCVGMSKMNFYRKIKALSNMTPAEFIRHIRLKEAARLLTTTQLTVAEIFYKTGFNNQSYFFREFKKLYQCSPNEYRVSQTNV